MCRRQQMRQTAMLSITCEICHFLGVLKADWQGTVLQIWVFFLPIQAPQESGMLVQLLCRHTISIPGSSQAYCITRHDTSGFLWRCPSCPWPFEERIHTASFFFLWWEASLRFGHSRLLSHPRKVSSCALECFLCIWKFCSCPVMSCTVFDESLMWNLRTPLCRYEEWVRELELLPEYTPYHEKIGKAYGRYQHMCPSELVYDRVGRDQRYFEQLQAAQKCRATFLKNLLSLVGNGWQACI